MIYENILPPELESDLSLSHSSIEREKDPQKFLIMTLHRDLNLTLYQAVLLVIELKVESKQDAISVINSIKSPSQHPFRQAPNTNLCAFCDAPSQSHTVTDNIVVQDRVANYLQRESAQLQCYMEEWSACPVCLELTHKNVIARFGGKSHDLCSKCFSLYLTNAISNGQVHRLICPHCKAELTDENIKAYTRHQTFSQYQKFRKNLAVINSPNCCWCPNIGCENIVYLKGGKTEQCSACNTAICPECRNVLHPQFSCQENLERQLDVWQQSRDIGQCPKCRFLVEKSHGCNHMTCQYCAHEWCWICGSDFTSIHFAFFNPLGCPAMMPGWIRRKDWTITKLILWRLICLLMVIIITPLFMIAFGPVFIMIEVAKSSWFGTKPPWARILIVLGTLIVGLLSIPLVVAVLIILLIPGLVALVWVYYEEKQRLERRHAQAMLRHITIP